MTNTSFVVAAVTGVVIALVVGWMMKRNGVSLNVASAWSVALASVVAIPLLSTDWADLVRRVIQPRQAIEWLPVALAILAALEFSLATNTTTMRWLSWIGMAVATALAFRFTYGSIYLRPNALDTTHIACIASWGVAMAVAWRWFHFALSRRNATWHWFAVLVLMSWFGALAVTLGTSGSFTYGAQAAVMGLVIVAAWMATGSPSALSPMIGLALLGLGIAFAELSWRSIALMLAASIVGWIANNLVMQASSDSQTESSASANTSSKKVRLTLGIVASGIAVTAAALSAAKFMSDVAPRSGSDYGGYEAYK